MLAFHMLPCHLVYADTMLTPPALYFLSPILLIRCVLPPLTRYCLIRAIRHYANTLWLPLIIFAAAAALLIDDAPLRRTPCLR